MSEKGTNLELSDEQREEVRQMLAQFGNKKDKQKACNDQQNSQQVIDPDPLEESPAGSTIEWTGLTPKTRRYPIVRETRAVFAPYIIDKIPLSLQELKRHIELLGMDVTSQNTSMTVCSVTQADPIRIFQVQTTGDESALTIDTIRYIV
jgi:hypothetical protein|tara:strand:+ start:1018 stop:1464 length:447 start_codon:yes stop_codon:yes gene_type:complete